MNQVVKAFKEWQLFNPDIDCTCATHYNLSGNPLPDELVCGREVAWRNYVKVRDSAPFVNKVNYEKTTEKEF
jgi:hypothetical protein